MSNDSHINPIAGWEFKSVEQLQLLLLEISFVSTPFQSPNEAQKTPTLALTAQQARELSEALKRCAERLEAEPMKSPAGPKH